MITTAVHSQFVFRPLRWMVLATTAIVLWFVVGKPLRADESRQNAERLPTRQNYASLSDAQKKAFIEAVVQLKQKPSPWPGYQQLERSDGTVLPLSVYDALVKMHVDAWFHVTVQAGIEPHSSMYRNAAHRGPSFFPWHRYFLHLFEQQLREVDPSLTVPYWDWTAEPTSPADPIWADVFLGGNGDPTKNYQIVDSTYLMYPNWKVVVGPNPDGSLNIAAQSIDYLQRRFGELPGPFGKVCDTLPRSTDVEKCLKLVAYDLDPWNGVPGNISFRNRLEGWVTKDGDYTVEHEDVQNHNRVHVWVGGSMRSPASPNDPLFYLHHAYVDYLWAAWQNRQLANPQITSREQLYLPRRKGPKGHRLNDTMFPFTAWEKVRPIDLLDHHDYLNFGYRYDVEGSRNMRKAPHQWWWERTEPADTLRATSNATDAVSRSRSVDVSRRVKNPQPLEQNATSRRSNMAREYRVGPNVKPLVLRVAKSRNPIWNPTTGSYDRVHLRNYNGGLVGPTIRARPGDTLRVILRNDLAVAEDSQATNIADITNLHTHGLHVSPSGNSDNVLLHLRPGDEPFEYEIKIPSDHPHGTFWYHAHVHGSTAVQVSSGMHGALIIEGGIEELPELEDAKEQIFLFQQIQYDEDGEVEDLAIFGPDTWEKSGRYTSINGNVQPTITMISGEVQHWRFIHGGVREAIHARLEGHSLHEVALDGITTGDRIERDMAELYPGYRMDVLVKAGTPGEYWLFDDPSPPGRALLRSFADEAAARRGGDEEKESRKALALIKVVEGNPKATQFPTPAALKSTIPKHLRKPIFKGNAPEPQQMIEFNIDIMSTPTGFLINGESYNPASPPLELPLGKREVWKLTSLRAGHPFHIHVNPFQVVEEQSDGSVRKYWKDTLFVTPEQEQIIHTKYRRYIGEFVLHCHILDHEDKGMMKLVAVVPPGHSDPGHHGRKSRGSKPSETSASEAFEELQSLDTSNLEDSDERSLRSIAKEGPKILIFSRGRGCLHCDQQLAQFAKASAQFRALESQLCVISSDDQDTLSRSIESYEHASDFSWFADPDQKVFSRFGCNAEPPLHGVFVLDAQNRICFAHRGEEPLMDFSTVLKTVRAARSKN